ncbi:MAG: type I-D CRISPR-associated protein Cas10d/Csc3 [Anaerolineae bacterium]|nr:type I-D CRISPR-associated protein Cas10d/Csc3 [Anaerolineae bacterium]
MPDVSFDPDALLAQQEAAEADDSTDPELDDQPLFAWLMQRAVRQTAPDDQVMADFAAHVAAPLSAQLALKTAKGGHFAREKLREGKPAEEVARYGKDQSLRAHLVNGLLPVAHIARRLAQWEAPRFYAWNETVYRVFCAGYIMHDWVKLPEIEEWLEERGVTHDTANPALHLPLFEEAFARWGAQMGLDQLLKPVGGLDAYLHDIIYIAVNTQKLWGTMHNYSALPNLQLDDRALNLATDLSTLADYVTYLAKTPREAAYHNGIRKLIDNLSNRGAQLVYHHVAENRGVLTNFIHNAAVDALRSETCIPLLYAPSGVVYLVQGMVTLPDSAEIANATIARIRRTCSERVIRDKQGMSRAMKGLKSAEYYPLLLSPAQQIEQAARSMYKLIHAKKKPASGKRYAKIREKGWADESVDLELPDTLAVDRLAEFIIFASQVTGTYAPEMQFNDRLLRHLDIATIQPTFETLTQAKKTGGVAYWWYYAAGIYVQRHGAGLSDDEWEQLLVNLAGEIGAWVEEAQDAQGEQDLWADVRDYIGRMTTFGPQTAAIDVQALVSAELQKYETAKLARRATAVCSLCSSPYDISPQREAGLLFAPNVYTNKQVLHGSRTSRHICQVCEIEFMLRQLLMNRGSSIGGRFEGRKFRYLYLYPSYFFTPETLVQMRYVYQRLKTVSFTTLRSTLLTDTPDGPELRLDAATLQQLRQLLMTPSEPDEDRQFRLHFPEQDLMTVFFWGLPPGRDAKDAEAWINPAFFALILPILLDLKVVATESPLPLLVEASELDETVFFDAPHNFVSNLMGQERITLDDLHIRLKALVAGYMVHIDGNAEFGSSGGYRWHAIPPVARNLVTNPLYAAAYLRKWQRKQDRDAMPADRAHLYRQYIDIFAEISSNGGLTMTHAQELTTLYRQFFRHKRLNSNSILRPITVASRAILDADPRLFDSRESLVQAVEGRLRSFMERVQNDKADGRLPKGSDWESREAAMHAFSEYFAGTIFFDILRGDRAALRGKQLNLLKDACEVIYRDENRKEWKQSTEKN